MKSMLPYTFFFLILFLITCGAYLFSVSMYALRTDTCRNQKGSGTRVIDDCKPADVLWCSGRVHHAANHWAISLVLILLIWTISSPNFTQIK